jgi:site-specific DNA-methyltransferase (adenine-specific)
MGNKPNWTLIKIRLGDMVAYEQNPRLSTKAQAQRIIASERKFNQVVPFIVSPYHDSKVKLYDGHQRLSAWLTVYGADHVMDAMQCDRELTDDEHKELIITMHSGATGSWDWNALSGWPAGKLQEWGMDKDTLKDWNNDANNLKELLNAEQPTADAEPQVDRAAELQVKWQTETGQVWQLGNHRLLVGDCTVRENVERLMGGERALVFSDAPYGIDIVQNNKVGGEFAAKNGYFSPIVGDSTTDTARVFYLLCVEFGFTDFILWGGNYFTDFLKPSSCWIIWDKRGDLNSNKFADCEMAWTSFDRTAKVYTQKWMGMIREGEHDKRVHPTQKPARVTQEIMSDFPADIYFDGFAGSGTTIIAAQNLSRRCYAMEISANYCAVILQRFSDAFPDIEITKI